MKKYCIFLCLFIILLLCGCSEDSDESKSANGYCPFQLEGKTLLLRNNDATIKLSAEHFKSGVVVNNVTVDYEKYPPSYSYVITNKNQAAYYLEATKKTYIPYYGTYNYGTFKFDIDLVFISAIAGTYSGVQTNANNKKTTITGTFTIK